MRITQLYVYPIKSLRGISLPTATLCAQGFAFDRRYILLRPSSDGAYTNMFVGEKPEMALFHCKITSQSTFTVEYRTPNPPVAPASASQRLPIEIPLEPDYDLERIHISLHRSPAYPAYRMPDKYNLWFTECFGYEVILAYTGDGVGIRNLDERTTPWIYAMEQVIPTQINSVSFSDGAALLVASETSVNALHTLLPRGEEVVLEKFRPNIVVDGTEPWDEDFWGELIVKPLGARLILTSNCARCISINVDLEKGRMGENESGKLLKKMMKNRRVDKGSKWEPIFGRYGFPTKAGKISVGDEVVISQRNAERTIWNGVMPRLASFDGVKV